MKDINILIYDLEVSPILGYTYGKYDTRVIKTVEEPFIMSISWRWYGEKKTHHFGGATNEAEEAAIAEVIWALFNEADVVVGHNANRFDNRVANSCLLRHDMGPPAPFSTVDTLRVARSVARFTSNSLNDLCALFGIGVKTKTTHADIWYECLQGSEKAWKDMEKYNNQDVDMLYKLYEKLRPWIKNHPNLADMVQVDGVCPKCLGSVRPYGSAPRRNGRVKSYICNKCGGRSNDNTIKREGARQVNA